MYAPFFYWLFCYYYISVYECFTTMCSHPHQLTFLTVQMDGLL